MKLKTVKRMNACVLSAAMVLSGVTIIPPATVSAAANNEINYALSAIVLKFDVWYCFLEQTGRATVLYGLLST